ncbi:MAG: hypothetical protein WAT79_08405 [Saprospiraceae bacterium]
MSSIELIKSVGWWESVKTKFVGLSWIHTHLCDVDEFKEVWLVEESRKAIIDMKFGFMGSHGFLDRREDYRDDRYFSSLFYYRDLDYMDSIGLCVIVDFNVMASSREIMVMFIDWVIGELSNNVN